VGFYDKRLLKFDRLLETYLEYAPKGFQSFLKSMPLWMKEKLWMPDVIRTGLAKVSGEDDERAGKREAGSLRGNFSLVIIMKAMLPARFIRHPSKRQQF